ncbi:hypothetical protein OQA88_3008 [Cercophora sp. LCS_1]
MANTDAYVAVGVILGTPLALYLTFLGLGSTAFFQRHFLYAHKIHTLWFHDINKPEKWGFAKNQVTPFSLKTCDDQTLYAWHVLPLPLYGRHEETLASQPTGFCPDFTKTASFLHGNAGHIAQAIRPTSYHALTDTSPHHILAIDYRGFGHSSGSPTEKGLIIDACTAINFALNTAKIPPSRIVLLGQSLGTAVASGAAEYFAKEGIDFAGVVLVAGFSSLPTMLSRYSIAGYVPVLAPFRATPWLLKQLMKRIVDKWETAERWREVVGMVRERGGRLNLQLVHARNDWDIPAHEDDKIFEKAVRGLVGETEGFEEEKKRRAKEREGWRSTVWMEGGVTVRQELVPYGGHNDLMFYAPTVLAVLRAFEAGDER